MRVRLKLAVTFPLNILSYVAPKVDATVQSGSWAREIPDGDGDLVLMFYPTIYTRENLDLATVQGIISAFLAYIVMAEEVERI